MSYRDPLINTGEGGDFQSYLEDTDVETGNSIVHLDSFLSRVYNYYVGRGLTCIVLRNSLNLITFIFTIFFATFLVTFVDYNTLAETYDWQQSINLHKRLHPITIVCVTLFCIFWVWQLLQLLRHTKHNWEIKRFYSEKLSITERDLQTMEWSEVAQKLGTIKKLCRVKDYLTTLDISYRIMRKENYLIALINKNLLNLKVPLPFISSHSVTLLSLSLTARRYSLFNFVFDEHQSIQPGVLDIKQRDKMSRRLKNRFVFMGLLSLILAPFMFVYLLVYFFFKYGEDLRTTPGSVLGTREWTPLAKWKFREFNELPHYLQNRLRYSYTPATTYIDQFPINSVTIVARFIAFIAGAGLAVLLLIGVWDEEILLNSEIYGKGPLWYAGILGTVVAVCRSVIPDEKALFEPQKNLDETCMHTHYWPKHWKGKAWTFAVRDEFCELFEYKAVLFVREIFSVILAPLTLIFSLPKCTDDIIDFFRECTVEIDGVGFVCSCASFENADKHANEKFGAASMAPKFMRTKQGKLEKSMLTFKVNNPDWIPPPQSAPMFGALSTFMETEANNPNINNSGNSSNHANLQASIAGDPILSQSLSVLSSSMAFAPPGEATRLDPKALAFLHKVQQRYREAKSRQQNQQQQSQTQSQRRSQPVQPLEVSSPSDNSAYL